MNCEQARQSWHDRLDGELSSEGEASLAIHLQGCESCRQWQAQMEAVTGGLTRLRDASKAVGKRKDEQSVVRQPHRNRLTIWNVGRLAAAVAFVITAGLLYTRQGGPEQLGTPPPTTAPGLHIPVGASETPTTEVILTDASAAEFIPVAQKTSSPNVHVFLLYRTVGETSHE